MHETSRKGTSAIQKDTENCWGLNDIKIGAELIKIGHLFKKFD